MKLNVHKIMKKWQHLIFVFCCPWDIIYLIGNGMIVYDFCRTCDLLNLTFDDVETLIAVIWMDAVAREMYALLIQALIAGGLSIILLLALVPTTITVYNLWFMYSLLIQFITKACNCNCSLVQLIILFLSSLSGLLNQRQV